MQANSFRRSAPLYEVLPLPFVDNKVADLRIQQLQVYCEQHLAESFTVQELAQLIGIGQRQLERLFLAALRCSPKQYIQALRLHKAAQLIGTGHYQLKVIRFMVGLPDAANFYHAFKAVYGCSPREYQRATLIAQKQTPE